jgi:PAS domain-containing protein
LPGDDLDDRCFRIVRSDRTVRWVTMHRQVELGPDGTVRAVIGVHRDVTAAEASRRRQQELAVPTSRF